MPGKRMRQLIKEEPGEVQWVHPLDCPAEVAEVQERDSRQRRNVEEGSGGSEFELRLMRANAETQAFAFQQMEHVRAMGEELLQTKKEMAELRAEIQAKEAAFKAELQIKDAAMQMNAAVLQSNNAVIEAKDALTCRLQKELRQGDGVSVAAQPEKSLNLGDSAAAASTFTPALASASAPATKKRFRDVVWPCRRQRQTCSV